MAEEMTDVAHQGEEVVSEITPAEITETPPEPTTEELKTQMTAIQAEKADLAKRLREASQAMTRKEFEALGREVATRLDKLDKAVDIIARFTLSDREMEEEAPAPRTAYDKFKQETSPKPSEQSRPPADLPPEVEQLSQKIESIIAQLGIAGKYVPPEMQDTMDIASAKWNRGDIQGAHDYLAKALEARTKPPEKTKVNIPQDRTPSQGGGNRRAWTEAQIAAMSDKEYAANREAIELALREGRIQLTRS